MCLNLNDNQLKTIRYSYRSTYMNPIIITNQKPIDAEKNFFKRNTSILKKKLSKPRGRNKKRKKWTKKNYKNNQKTIKQQ